MEEKRQEYALKLHAGEPVAYKFLTFNTRIRDLTLSLISQFLAEMHLSHIRSSIFTFITEAVNNAVKANIKRVYFKSLEMDTDDDSYEYHLQNFNQVVANFEDYVHDLKKEDLSVQISMQQRDDGLNLSVTNNTGIQDEELKRIQERVEMAATYESMDQALEQFIDTSEGGGLGVILTILLLKKTGIPAENFRIESNGKLTRASILIPKNIGKPAYAEEIEKRIIDEIDMIPPFPDTVQRVLDVCDDPDSDSHRVAREIEQDPALTADVLKIVNSAAFVKAQKINNLSTAVTILGLKAIRQLTVASASVNVLNEKYGVYEDFWSHSFKCGFYAKKIAEHLKLDVESESVYLGGLLHDLGKIVLHNIDPDIMNQLNVLSLDKTRTTSATLEEVNLGISHAHIGAVVAENWDFDSDLVEMIRNHHRPFIAPASVRQATSVIHLADAFLNIELKKGNYVYIDIIALQELNLDDMDRVSALHDSIKAEYEKEREAVHV